MTMRTACSKCLAALSRLPCRASARAWASTSYIKEYPLVINGEKIFTGKTIASINPSSPDDIVGAVAEAGIPETERAVKAARDAFEKWRWTPFEERAQLLERAQRAASIKVTAEPAAAIAGADVVNTDVWTSMGQEAETERRLRAFAGTGVLGGLTTMSAVAATFASHWREMSPEQVDESIDALGRQGERARVLISNLLDLAKLERGDPDIRLEPVSVAVAVKQTLETAPEPEGKTVEVNVEDHVKVLADPGRFEQVLSNLLTNAYRYGGEHIKIDAGVSGEEVVVTVRDDGPGVAEDLVPNIFQPLTRGRDARGVGSGLGLAIVSRIVGAFGGRISCEPNDPRGARFTIRLRRAD